MRMSTIEPTFSLAIKNKIFLFPKFTSLHVAAVSSLEAAKFARIK